MLSETFTPEYQRVCRLITEIDIAPGERKKAFDAILGIRKLLEEEQIDCEAAKGMAAKLATAVRFAARPTPKKPTSPPDSASKV
jgi:hypothetical protein